MADVNVSARTPLTQELVRELLEYDPETGIFTWKRRDRRYFVSSHACRVWNKRFPGKRAGTVSSEYVLIMVLWQRISAHRLAFLYMTGEIPAYVDHKDGDPANNRWTNLRPATNRQNCANSRSRNTSGLGIKGVTRTRNKNRYEARIWTGGRLKYLGTFDTPSEASAAYMKALRSMHGAYAYDGYSSRE